jgi:hypothetical protein
MPQKTFLKQDIYQYRSIGEAINQSFTILRSHGFSLIGAMLKVSGVLAGAYFIFGYLSQQELMGNLESPNFGGGLSSFFTLTQLLNVLLSLLFSFLAQMAVYAWIRAAQEQEDAPQLNQVWKYIGSRIPTLLGVGLALIVVYGLLVALFVSMGAAAAILVFVLLIPFLYVFVRLGLFFPALILEDNRLSALRRSWNLVKEEWFSTFGFFIVLGIISYVLMIVVSIPFLVAAGAIAYFQLGESQGFESIFLSDAYFMANNISGVLTVFLNALLAGVGSSVWFGSLVDKKESVHIKKQIAEAAEEHNQTEQEGEY